MVYSKSLAILVALCTIVLMNGCKDAGSDILFAESEGVRILAGDSSFLITNNSGKTISVFLVEQQAAMVVDWIPVCDSTRAIKQGASVEKPYSGILGYSTGCTVVAYWWGCTPTFDGHVRSVTVKTKS